MEEKEYKPARKTTPELAKDYKVSERSIRRMRFLIKDKMGERKGHYNSPEQVEIFIEEYGRPWVLIPLIWAANALEAHAQKSPNYTELPHIVATHHEGKTFSTGAGDMTKVVFHPLTWIAAILVMFYNMLDLAHSYNPYRPYSGNKMLRRIRAIFLISVSSAVFVALGYFVGKMVF